MSGATVDAAAKKQVKIGDYVLSGKIGFGGVAEIYKARQESLDRDVAIKILSSKLTRDPDIVRRFERESLVIAKLNHPNIVHVIDRGQAGGRYYFVMEYVDGTSLREVINSDQVTVNTKLEMIVQVCKALDYAHKNGVIHRDIKPTNILIDRQGNVLVADFGIAQIVGTPEHEMTATDVVMGTLAYMSPEQKISSTNVDQTTDIWAVGVMLYEILTGGTKPLGRFKMPSELSADINPSFDGIIAKCLAPDARDRYQRIVELKDDILEILRQDPEKQAAATRDLPETDSGSFQGKCRFLDTIKETRFGSTILVENELNKKLYVIRRHSRGEHGRKEARLLSRLKHKHIVDIQGAGGDAKNTVIITEYCQNGSLAERMVRKYPWGKALEVVVQAAQGLNHAHTNNIVHGNVRPTNVLFDAADVVKLSDFGMPPHYENPKKKNWYAAPELKRSKQADIYSLGVILHQLIAGRVPSYDAGGNLRLDDVKMEVPEEVLEMIRKFLAIRVSRRYATCQEFLLEYDEYERQSESRRRAQANMAPAEERPSGGLPLWQWLLIGAGLVIGIVVALVLSGAI